MVLNCPYREGSKVTRLRKLAVQMPVKPKRILDMNVLTEACAGTKCTQWLFLPQVEFSTPLLVGDCPQNVFKSSQGCLWRLLWNLNLVLENRIEVNLRVCRQGGPNPRRAVVPKRQGLRRGAWLYPRPGS